MKRDILSLRARLITENRLPGVHISPDFEAILKKELRYSRRQFESAQWRRLQLQVAGCKLLGYTGVQIAGLETPEQVNIACRRVSEALEEFKIFEEWKEVFLEHQARANMAPYPHQFYMFEKLFTSAHLAEAPQMKNVKMAASSGMEKLNFRLCRFLFTHASRQAADEHLISKNLLVGCPRCSYCRLPLTHYICPETCPKGLANGACGGTRADGSCEFGNRECIHAKQTRLATWLNEIDTLEERYIKPAE